MYVYFVQAWSETWSDGPRIKIGKAGNPEKRMLDLQVGCPVKLEMLGTIQCRDSKEATKTERAMHKRFKSRRAIGEWFLFSHDAKSEVRGLIANHQGPFTKPQPSDIARLEQLRKTGVFNLSIDRVTIEKFAELSGYSQHAIRTKISRDVWKKDQVWFHAPDSRVLISIRGYEAWVESPPAPEEK